MKGSIVYDIVTTVGIIIMIFLIIYWSLIFGTDIVAGMLLTSPAVAQASLASALSFGCRGEDFEFSYPVVKPSRFDIFLISNSLQAVPPAKKIRDWTNIERGGYVQYSSINPSPLITCSRSPAGATYAASGGASLNIIKNSTFFGMEAR